MNIGGHWIRGEALNKNHKVEQNMRHTTKNLLIQTLTLPSALANSTPQEASVITLPTLPARKQRHRGFKQCN